VRSRLIVDAFFQLKVLSGYRWCLLHLFPGANEDVKVANAEEVHDRKDQDDVGVDVLSTSKAILIV